MRAIRNRVREELGVAYRCDDMLCLHASIMLRGRRGRDEDVHTCNFSIAGIFDCLTQGLAYKLVRVVVDRLEGT